MGGRRPGRRTPSGPPGTAAPAWAVWFPRAQSLSSRRCICVSNLTLAALRLHRQRTTSELVFPNSWTRRRSRARWGLRSRLPSIVPCCHRSGCAICATPAPPSFWRQGGHPKLVPNLLRHSTVALTLNTYCHVTSGLSREVARTMERVRLDQPVSGDHCLAQARKGAPGRLSGFEPGLGSWTGWFT